MDRDPWGDTRWRQQETNEESEIETKKRKGGQREPREGRPRQPGGRAETRRVTSGSRGAPTGREQLGKMRTVELRKGRGGKKAVSAQ